MFRILGQLYESPLGSKSTREKNCFSRTNANISRRNEKFSCNNEKFSRTNEKNSHSNEKISRTNEKNSRRNEKLSRSNENISCRNEKISRTNEKNSCINEKNSRRNENISRNNEKISRRNEKLSRSNENISRTNEKNSRTNEKVSKRKKGELFTSVNRSLSLLNRIKLSLQYKAIIIIVRYDKGLPQRALTIKEKYTVSVFNPVINEALRRVNNGYPFYDKIKPILLQIHKWIRLMLIFTVQL